MAHFFANLRPPWLSYEVLLAALSNLAVSFNVVNISLVLKIMGNIYHESEIAQDGTSSALIAGMILGQLVLGFLGDLLGRQRCLFLTLSLAICGAIGSVLAFAPGVFIYLTVWRFVLGVGAGGVYPLAAIYAKESAVSKETESTGVVFVFSMQGLGYILAPITTLIVLQTVANEDAQWRIILGVGAFLLSCVLWLLLWTPVNARNSKRASRSGSAGSSLCHIFSLLKEREYFFMLVGTAGCWFVFDVTFYGNNLFQTQVLEDAFGQNEDISMRAIESTIVYAMALPGYYVSVGLMQLLGPKIIQLQGFLMMAVLYIFIGSAWDMLDQKAALLLILYGLTFFFSNFGPNSTTFILPSLTFPSEVCSTLNGISAAMGKLGALVGSSCFEPASKAIGPAKVMIMCGAISILGLLLTVFFVNEPGSPTSICDDEEDIMSTELLTPPHVRAG